MLEYTRITTYDKASKLYIRVLVGGVNLPESVKQQCKDQDLIGKEITISLDVNDMSKIKITIEDVNSDHLYATPILFEILSRLNLLLDNAGWKPGMYCTYVAGAMRFMEVSVHPNTSNMVILDSVEYHFNDDLREWMGLVPPVIDSLVANGFKEAAQLYTDVVDEAIKYDNIEALRIFFSSDACLDYVDNSLLIKAERLIRDNA